MRPTVGVSSCLLGRPVRYDGGHKRNEFVVEELARAVRLVPVCPEVELGLGTPRETLTLVRRAGEIRLVMANGVDYTEPMRAYAERRVEELAAEGLDGFVLKKNSPSCGPTAGKVYEADAPTATGRGLFADALVRRLPLLPVEDEERLSDAPVRASFLDRVAAHASVRAFFGATWTPADLSAFHARHVQARLADAPQARAELEQVVRESSSLPASMVRERYVAALMAALTSKLAGHRGPDPEGRG